MDEDVLQRGLGLLPFDRGIGAIGLDGLEQRLAVGAADMQRRAEGRRGGDARRVAQLTASRSAPAPDATKAIRPDALMISSAVPRAISSP